MKPLVTPDIVGTPLATPPPDCADAQNVVAEIVRYLEYARDRINAEIGSYPTPIPACDVHFNRLLEERAWVFEDLIRMETLRAIPKYEVEQVVAWLRAAKSLDAPTLDTLLRKAGIQ